MFIPMKLVQCKITVHNAEDYRKVIDKLLHIFMSHEAKYEAPRGFVITCFCSHIHAERNLDNILTELHLQAEKNDFEIPERNPIKPQEMQGPPAPLVINGEVLRVSPPLTGRTAFGSPLMG